MEGLTGYIAIGIISLVVGMVLRSLERKPNIAYWQPHYALFKVPDPEITVQTDSINIQNLGSKEAEAIEIIFKEKPDHFQFTPSIQFATEQTPNNEFLIKLDTLGPKEFITLHILSYATAPKVELIRCKTGIAKMMPYQTLKKYPRWFELGSALMLLVGLGFTIYWLIMAIIFISRNIGIT